MEHRLIKILKHGKLVNICLYKDTNGHEIKGLSVSADNAPILVGDDSYVERIFNEFNHNV